MVLPAHRVLLSQAYRCTIIRAHGSTGTLGFTLAANWDFFMGGGTYCGVSTR